jgi:hypothetical protein
MKVQKIIMFNLVSKKSQDPQTTRKKYTSAQNKIKLILTESFTLISTMIKKYKSKQL